MKPTADVSSDLNKDRLTLSQKVLLYGGLALLVAAIPWRIFITDAIHRTLIKTNATVVAIQTNIEDTNVYDVPIFEYTDHSGQPYREAGGESVNTNTPFRSLFLPKIGGRVTAYYDNHNPSQAAFMYGVFMQTVPWYPAILGVMLLVGLGVWLLAPVANRRIEKLRAQRGWF